MIPNVANECGAIVATPPQHISDARLLPIEEADELVQTLLLPIPVVDAVNFSESDGLCALVFRLLTVSCRCPAPAAEQRGRAGERPRLPARAGLHRHAERQRAAAQPRSREDEGGIDRRLDAVR